MINIVLSGGSGTRLWPLSRIETPKQFVDLLNGDSLFKKTIARNNGFANEYWVVTNELQAELAKKQIDDKLICNFLLEPIGRNTAPAVALACMLIDPNELVLVSSSDQIITKTTAYNDALKNAVELAKDGFLVTFGIKPNYPETGFGYIQAKGNDVLSFKEKPDLQTAIQYVDSGQYLWNCGMFCFKAGVFLNELQKYAPEVFTACLASAATIQKFDNSYKPSLSSMQAIPSISIDYAVMEQSSIVKVVAADLGWSDLGSFDALANCFEQENKKNTIIGEKTLIDSENNFVFKEPGKHVALLGVNDLIIIDSSDALLITRKGLSQGVSKIVDQLKLHKPDLVKSPAKKSNTYWINSQKISMYPVRLLPSESKSIPLANFDFAIVQALDNNLTIKSDSESFSLRKFESIRLQSDFELFNSNFSSLEGIIQLCCD